MKKEEYDIWAMEMEHYLEYIDNDAWKVIQNGNSKKRISTRKDGVIRILPPVTAAEIQAVEKERKAKNILLMAIPKEHMRRFHGMDDAKEIWEAIRTRFGGNANSKKMQKAVFKQQFEAFTISSSEGLEKGYDRFQQLLSQLEAHGAEVSTEDANYKFLRNVQQRVVQDGKKRDSPINIQEVWEAMRRIDVFADNGVEPSCVSHIKSPRQPLKDKETHKVNRKSWNDMMERELGEGYSFTKKKCFVCGSLNHLIKDCDYYEMKMAREAEVKRVVNTGNGVAKPVWTNANRINHANQFVPRSVQLNAGRPKFNTVRPNINTGRTNINSGRPKVNAVSPKVNTVRPKQPISSKTSNSSSL
ncbi:hypothetical protein Tco_0478964 [Tanacetum coccineum]